ncbi:flavonol 3-O-glucosyltransferase UGT89B1-like [Dioscorea cayenensis subsp. rotundata]|uniref:Flavonol 3-O-glucosyltransferase UGT89B1-like n=1 Tax=Dioscorea cayennensis subsp. rotundata TaxID=55577 RepID=A0AB40AVR6_DIOCR|nr:flavonol 3-O-glucosyltransferase UGT89B1-like [Dioscorea cayenensis subsp. rotundata]XP_039118683.1 flavonol 3-O-glucosyltransferase UGT89B1-like [Dioscorea cayenensis subsp. rotundata]
MAENQDPSPPLHLLVIPFPAQGHLLPLLHLLHHLSNLLPSLSFTIVSTPSNLHLLQPFLSSTPSATPLLLPLSLPPSFHHVRTLPSPSDVSILIHALSLLSDDLLLWSRSHRPTAIISDFFLPWTHHLATDIAVPNLVFYSTGTLLISILHRLWIDLPLPSHSPISFPSIPGSPSFPFSHLPSLYRRYLAGSGSPEWQFVKDEMIAGDSAFAAIINTFDAIDGVYLSHLKNEMRFSRVFAVGPIHPGFNRADPMPEELSTWLDDSPARSVVYVCFGSQFTPGIEQGLALANALERSGTRFVWCVGNDWVAGDRKLVPEGFEERVKGRGMVVRGWAPQVEILRHGAVASFLTHCGWNSVLEGIVAGVMLMAWPMEADQFLNAKVLVEELGVAVMACGGGPEMVPDVEELGKMMAESVEKKEGRWMEIRKRAWEMGRMAEEAVGESGSSFRDVAELVVQLKELALRRTL